MVLVHRHDGWHETLAFGGRDHHRFAALHDRGDGVGGAQVYADDLAHECLFSDDFVRPVRRIQLPGRT